jgi:hypothetical protein
MSFCVMNKIYPHISIISEVLMCKTIYDLVRMYNFYDNQ